MKNGWHSRKLSEVCGIMMGTSPPGNTYNAVGEGMPLINGPVEFSPGTFGKTIRTRAFHEWVYGYPQSANQPAASRGVIASSAERMARINAFLERAPTLRR